MPVDARAIALQASYTRHQAFSGQVEARRSSSLGFDAAGRLDRMLVDEGDRVQAGDLLAELDAARPKARRAELVAAQAEAEARLALAEATLRRQRGVVDQGGVSRQGLDEARENRRMADAALRLAKQRIASIDVDLAKTRLLAPFDGTVINRLVDEGRVLGSGEAVIHLQEQSAPQIRIGIAGLALDALQVGQTYALQWQGRPLQAQLRALVPVRNTGVRTVDALFDPVAIATQGGAPADPPDQAHLLPGDTVTLSLATTIDTTGAWVPMTALAAGERGLWSLYVVRSEPGPEGADAQRVERRTVDVLHQTSDRVFVRGNLQTADIVVQRGLQRIVPGQRVVIARPRPAAAS